MIHYLTHFSKFYFHQHNINIRYRHTALKFFLSFFFKANFQNFTCGFQSLSEDIKNEVPIFENKLLQNCKSTS